MSIWHTTITRARPVAYPGPPSALLAAIAAALCCGAAQAQPPARADDGSLSVVVRYADLDVVREAGARILRNRIDVAASRVCGGIPDARLLARTADFRRCRKAALARAMGDLRRPTMLAQSDVAPPPE